MRLENRKKEEQVRATKFRRPLIIEHVLEYNTLTEARIMERKFKKSLGLLLKELKNKNSERSSDG